MLFVVQKIFAHRASAVRSEILQRRRLGSRRADDDGVLHRAVIFERLHHLRDCRFLLADGHVNANDAFALLIDDRVDGDRGLACLTVADDQLALTASDRNHRVDRFEAGLQRLFHRLTIDDARCDALDSVELRRLHRSLAVDWYAERIDHAADHRRADWNGHDLASTAHLVAFLDGLVFAEENAADVVLFEVERQADDVMRKLHELAGHDAIESVDARDPIADGDHRAHFGDVDTLPDSSQLLTNDLGDFISLQISCHNSSC